MQIIELLALCTLAPAVCILAATALAFAARATQKGAK